MILGASGSAGRCSLRTACVVCYQKSETRSICGEPNICVRMGMLSGMQALSSAFVKMHGKMAPTEMVISSSNIVLIKDVGPLVVDIAGECSIRARKVMF